MPNGSTKSAPKYGGWTGILDTLGLFSVFSSIWFKGTLLLLSTSVLTCSARRAPRLWRTATRPRMVMTEAFFERAPHRATIASEDDPGAALAALRAAFGSHHFRTATEQRRRRRPCLRRPLPLVAVREDRRPPQLRHHPRSAPRSPRRAASGTKRSPSPSARRSSVGNGTGLTVEAKSFSDSYYTSGEPSDYASKLVLYKNGARVKAQEVRVNHPMRYDGVTFYQSFFGPAVVMQAKTGDGQVAFDRGVPLLFASQDERHRSAASCSRSRA